MSLSRDRLARPVDISTLIPNATRRVGLIVDEPGLHRGLGTPVRDEAGSSAAVASGSVAGRGMLRRSPIGRVNARMRALRRARGRGVWLTSSGLRSWYPRTPLRDVTAVVRAIERRRSRGANESEAQSVNNEGTSDQTHTIERTTVLNFQDENVPPSAQLEHDMSFKTPLPASFSKKPQHSPASRAWSIVASIAREKHDGSLTPEKKLLSSIEKVREVLLEDQRRMQNTPAAKKAERERKIRTLKGEFWEVAAHHLMSCFGSNLHHLMSCLGSNLHHLMSCLGSNLHDYEGTESYWEIWGNGTGDQFLLINMIPYPILYFG
ncbi:hypothetical protein V2J09_015954 [Rumex salicifolius]